MLAFLRRLSLFQKVQIVIILLLVIGLPLFYIVSKMQQDTRQRASEGGTTLEVENGQISGDTIRVIPDDTSSGGKHLLFNSPTQ